LDDGLDFAHRKNHSLSSQTSFSTRSSSYPMTRRENG